MIVAVTGANGFIGQHLVRTFGEAGWETRPVVRRDFDHGRVDALFDGADVVVHAAGATRAPTPQQLNDSNVGLTTKVIAAARAARVGRFVYLSSQAAAGPARSLDARTSEDALPSPHEAYGRSKLEAERLVRAGEIPFVIVRPAAVYGPGDRDFLTVFRLARAGVALHAGNRDQWISIVHVADAARAVVLMATELRAVGGTFFVANDEPIQWKTLFADVARCAERSLSVDLEIPAALVRVGAMVGDVAARITGKAGLLTSEKVALGEPPFWVCSNERAKRELGFSPGVPLHDGLCETYHWYLTNRWL